MIFKILKWQNRLKLHECLKNIFSPPPPPPFPHSFLFNFSDQCNGGILSCGFIRTFTYMADGLYFGMLGWVRVNECPAGVRHGRKTTVKVRRNT